MTCTLANLLSELPPHERRPYLDLPEDLKPDLVKYIKTTGKVPPVGRLTILLGPECVADYGDRRHGWMAM